MNRLYILFALVMLFVTACNKESTSSANANNATTASDAISADDVTQAITNSVSGSTSGFATQTETTAQLAANPSTACGTTTDTNISGSSSIGALISYNYNFDFTRTCVCINGIKSQVNTAFSGITGYSLLTMSSNDTANVSISVSGFNASASAYVLNENYVLKGTQQSFNFNQHSFNSTLTITSGNITVSKSTNKIVSGNASVQFNGTSSTGASVSHSAALTFLGNDQATLVVDNGQPQTISW